MTNETASDCLASHYEELRKALEHYGDTFCEGWCQGGPHFDFKDCAGCPARNTLASQFPPPTDDGLRKRIAAAISDPGQTEGFKGDDRTLTEWQTDAVMRALSTQLPPPISSTELWKRCGSPESRPATFEEMERSHKQQGDGSVFPPPIRWEGLVEQVATAMYELLYPNARLAKQPEYTKEHYRGLARQALATPSSPEGWVLVPREPTEEMVEAGDELQPFARGTETHAMAGGITPEKLWAAMLAASPSSKENKS